MDVSELRQKILRSIDEARRDASERRTVVDDARKAYGRFLSDVAVPLLRQSASVLNATGAVFSVNTPAESARLVADGTAATFLELELDTNREHPEVIGRVSVTRGGRRGQVVEERPIAAGKPVERITEDDVSQFLISEIPKLIVRS
jgi:hypothetical protein